MLFQQISSKCAGSLFCLLLPCPSYTHSLLLFFSRSHPLLFLFTASIGLFYSLYLRCFFFKLSSYLIHNFTSFLMSEFCQKLVDGIITSIFCFYFKILTFIEYLCSGLLLVFLFLSSAVYCK